MTPFGTVNGMTILQGGTVPSNLSLTRNTDKTVTVHNNIDISDTLGLVSGTVYVTDDCPDDAAIGHWDSAISNWGSSWPPNAPGDTDGLNKDDDSRPLFINARDLAIKQTEHEWCRLVGMVNDNYGQVGVDKLFLEWVSDTKYKDALDICPTLNICVIPVSGDWTITQDCTFSGTASAPANVLVQDNAVLTIVNGASLDVNLVNNKITVQEGSGIMIKQGGKIH